MLPRQERLSRRDFPKGRGISAPFSFGTLRMFPSPTFKASVVISKKTIRRAVERRRAKRKAYAALEVLKERLSPTAYVFFPNQNVIAERVSAMRQELKEKLF